MGWPDMNVTMTVTYTLCVKSQKEKLKLCLNICASLPIKNKYTHLNPKCMVSLIIYNLEFFTITTI